MFNEVSLNIPTNDPSINGRMASHYWGRIHMATRFDPDNVTIECQYDNRLNSSHLIYLGKYLEKKLGSKKMELLEWKHRQAKNWSLFELQELIEFYKKEVERLKKEKESKN